MLCPACGFENLQGADRCEECHSPIPDTPEQSEPTFVGKNRTLSDTIEKAGTRPTIIVKRTTSVHEVVRQMKAKKVGCALIVDYDEVAGIFTERDVLHKASKPEMDLKDTEVENIMTPSPEVLHSIDSFALAINKMAMGNFRHVPIRHEDGSYSVFSVRDALRYFF